MAILVVDASALASVLFGQPEGPAVELRLRGGELHAPALLRYELASVCPKKARRYPALRDRLFRAMDWLEDFGIAIHDVDLFRSLALAERHGLPAYDAIYLWLAADLDAELVTLDGRLSAAAIRQPR